MITCKMNVSKHNRQNKVYGLDFFDAGKRIRRIPGVTTSLTLIRQLMKKIGSANLSKHHIDDVIEDFLP